MAATAARIRVVSGALVAAAALLAAGPTPAAGLATPTPLAPADNATVQALPAFAWSAVAGAARYEFQFAADSGFNSPVLGRGEDQFFTRNTRATLKKTIPNGTYYWRVRAVDAQGQVSPWSAPRPLRKAWTAAPALQAPAHGAVVSHPASPLVLRWSAVPYAAKYLVTIASDPLLGSAVGGQANVETSGTVYAPRALLLPPGTYYWGVTPLDSQGHRGVSSPVGSFTWTWPTATSTGVQDLVADTEVYDSFFSWNPVPGAAKYELEINPTADFSPGSKVCCSGTMIATSHAPTTVLRDNTYHWRVRALDAFGNAGVWNVGTPFTKTFDKAPPVVGASIKNLRMRDHLADPGSDIDADTPGYQTEVPVLRWDPVPGAASYEVDVAPYTAGVCDWSAPTSVHWRVKTSVPFWTPLGSNWVNVKPYPDAATVANDGITELVDGWSYCARVRARTDRDGFEEVYGDYTYVDDGTGKAFEFVTFPAGQERECAGCAYQRASDYLLPQTGTTTLRTPFFSWNPLPRSPKKTLLNTNGAEALTLTERADGLTDLAATVRENPGDSAFEDLVLSSGGTPMRTYTYPDGNLTSLANSIRSESSVTRPVDVVVHVANVPLARVTATPFTSGRQSYYVLVAKDPSFSNIVDYAFTQLPVYAPRNQIKPTTYADEETLYYWAVLPAIGWGGNLPGGNPLLANPRSFQKMSNPPTLVSPGGGENVTGQPTFRWTLAEGARRFRLQVSQDPSFGTLLDDVSTASTAYTAATSYPADTVLYWRVRADDENLIGLRWSSVGTFQRRLPVPAPKFDMSAGDMYPLISWNPVGGAVSYRIAVDEADGERYEYDDFRSAAAAFVKMTGTGVVGIRVRANFPTKSGQTTAGPWSPTIHFTRTMGEPTGAATDATPESLLFRWDPKPGTKQYRVVVSNREDFAMPIEDVTTDNTSYAPQLTHTMYLQGGTFYWRVSAIDEDRNVGDFTRPHTFVLRKTGGTTNPVVVTQRLRVGAAGRLRAKRLRRVVITVKAGGKPVAGAKVRGIGAGLLTRYRATNRRGQVTFRVKPKRRGFVLFQATKARYIAGAVQVRVR